MVSQEAALGLDVVEVVMRCEEVFGVTLPNADLGSAVTVGGLYDLVCRELGVVALSSPGSEVGVARSLVSTLKLNARPWTAEEVWATLRVVVRDQLQVPLQDVRWDSRWVADLGAD